MSEVKTREESKQEVQPARRHMLAPFGEFERMMEDIFSRGWPARFERMWPASAEERMPTVDVVDDEDKVTVRAELPGVDKKDIDVSVSDHTVTIKGEVKRETEREQGDYYRHEIQHGTFARTLTLPAEVDGSKAKAILKDGMLEVTLPKIEEAKRHNVKID